MAIATARAVANRFLNALGVAVVGANKSRFRTDYYLRHDARRMEHLASLKISVANMSVLEVGAGIGDLSHYYIDRGCEITITEARQDNLRLLKARYPGERVEKLDLEAPHAIDGAPFDIVHCYGLLYHLGTPEASLQYLSNCCKQLLFLETRVSFGDDEDVNLVSENKRNQVQATSGIGCRPTRTWVFSQLRRHFEHVYVPKTQPNHPEFPLDWKSPPSHKGRVRSVFIASRKELANDALSSELLERQERHI